MTSKGFITISLPENTVKQIDQYIKKYDGLYVSRTHVIKVALNKYFKEEK